MQKSAVFVVALLAAVPAMAAPPGLLDTEMAGNFAYPPPPPGFDPLQATARELRSYGFPPRPDGARARRAYAGWARIVSSAKIWVQPHLVPAPVHHVPMKAGYAAHPAGNMSYSTNWSGTVLTTGANAFGSSSLYTLWGEFNVPIAQQAFGVCSGTDYSSTWVGMDGYNNGADIVQAGSESDASCSNGNVYADYYAWYEWFPADTIEIQNFPISPGDDIGVQAGVSNPTTASIFMTNETTNQYFAVQMNAPNGTKFIGNSAEWIVERPEVNNATTTLANYVTDWVSNMIALLDNASHSLEFGGIGGAGVSAILVTMTDKNGNNLSVPTNLGGGGVVYHDTGAAK
jgi:hypothetical protein